METISMVLPSDPQLLALLKAHASKKGYSFTDTVNRIMRVLEALANPADRPMYVEAKRRGLKGQVILLEAVEGPKVTRPGKRVKVHPQNLEFFTRYCQTRVVSPLSALHHGLILLDVAERGHLHTLHSDGTSSSVTITEKE